MIDICMCVFLRKYFFIYRIQSFPMKVFVFLFCIRSWAFKVNFEKGIRYELTLQFFCVQHLTYSSPVYLLKMLFFLLNYARDFTKIHLFCICLYFIPLFLLVYQFFIKMTHNNNFPLIWHIITIFTNFTVNI